MQLTPRPGRLWPLLTCVLLACGSKDSADDTAPADDSGDDTAAEAEACMGWEILSELYSDVAYEDLSTCSSEQGLTIEATLMNFEGVTITGNSVVAADGSDTLSPCVEVLCDDDYAYIASNALPHYNPQAAPIFDTEEKAIVHRIPLYPTSAVDSGTADSWLAPEGCDDALSMYVDDVTPEMPPSSHCWYETEDGSANTGDLYISDGEEVMHKVHCYGQTAGLITGVPSFAPSEEARPDPYGSPLFWTYADQETLFVDLCGTHPAAITHNHWVNEVCLAQDADNKPANSYATGAAAFVIEDLDAADCAEESDVLGWAYDGYPMRGSCVCMERDGAGNCTDLRRARSGYVYAGLARWADDESEDSNLHTDAVQASALGYELQSCSSDSDCCEGDRCELYCHPLLVEEGDGVAMESVCVTPDYSWCGHEWLEHASITEDAGYVYLDRCNGVETADGYSYVGTPTFPYVNGCYKGEPTAMATDDTYTRLDVGGGP